MSVRFTHNLSVYVIVLFFFVYKYGDKVTTYFLQKNMLGKKNVVSLSRTIKDIFQ